MCIVMGADIALNAQPAASPGRCRQFNRAPMVRHQIRFKIFLIFFLISLLGCDPGRYLVIKCSNKPNVSINIYANENILPGHHSMNPEKIIIRRSSAPNFKKSDTTLHYGIGSWKGEQLITSFANNIDSIIISGSSRKLSLINKLEIIKYLSERRGGYAKARLKIVAR
jgi:hypothetical protein